ncbi:MAG TPA: DUF374 domain-containing protein [Gemmatimonadota bacterium]|nr:DUF374 domain-containing protein [Gemmatimonadota bacterium]
MSRPVLRAIASRGGWLVARLVEALSRTWRIDVSGNRHLQAIEAEGDGVVFCFWHGRMLELAVAHARHGVGVLVSSHPDGIMAARIIAPLGYIPIRGSRRRNPVAGFRAMLRHAESGGDLALSPDAHSDIHRVLPGAVALARRSGHVLVPVAAAARPCRRVVSWDRFEIPWPGARVRIRYGEPVRVPAGVSAAACEKISRDLERRLRALHREIEEELAGRPRRVARRPSALTPR